MGVILFTKEAKEEIPLGSINDIDQLKSKVLSLTTLKGIKSHTHAALQIIADRTQVREGAKRYVIKFLYMEEKLHIPCR